MSRCRLLMSHAASPHTTTAEAPLSPHVRLQQCLINIWHGPLSDGAVLSHVQEDVVPKYTCCLMRRLKIASQFLVANFG